MKTMEWNLACMFKSKSIRFLGTILVVVAVLLYQSTYADTQVSQFGITWTFDHDYQVGRFINGDWWVLDEGSGVNVISVSPAPTGSGSSFRHGSMVNPMLYLHSYDGACAEFSESLIETFPLNLNGNDSLISTKSLSAMNSDLSHVQTAAVLTVLNEIPPADAFRPTYAGTDKPLYRTSELKRDLLLNLPMFSKF